MDKFCVVIKDVVGSPNAWYANLQGQKFTVCEIDSPDISNKYKVCLEDHHEMSNTSMEYYITKDDCIFYFDRNTKSNGLAPEVIQDLRTRLESLGVDVLTTIRDEDCNIFMYSDEYVKLLEDEIVRLTEENKELTDKNGDLENQIGDNLQAFKDIQRSLDDIEDAHGTIDNILCVYVN